MNETMHSLHDQANESMARRLSDALLAMRGGAGQLDATGQETGCGDAASADAPGVAGQAGDIGRGEGDGFAAVGGQAK